jgi:hypothetical protein
MENVKRQRKILKSSLHSCEKNENAIKNQSGRDWK